MIITDKSKLKYSIEGDFEIGDEYVVPGKYYTRLDKKELVGMKPLGRIYFEGHQNLNYTDGAPVEKPIISGGENGVLSEYLRAGKRVYTEDQVINIINSRCYEYNDNLKPKITAELEGFLKGVADNTAKNKPQKAKELLEKYPVIGAEETE